MNNVAAYLNEADRSLKGLLMDKGELSVEDAFQRNQQRAICLQKAMCDLVEMYAETREAYRVNCLGLFLVRNLQGANKSVRLDTLSYFEQRGAMWLDWRATAEWIKHYGYGDGRQGLRVNAFDNGVQSNQVKEFVVRQSEEFYEVLLGYENLRVSLNVASRVVRKTMNELMVLRETKRGFRQDTKGWSRKILKTMGAGKELEVLLSV